MGESGQPVARSDTPTSSTRDPFCPSNDGTSYFSLEAVYNDEGARNEVEVSLGNVVNLAPSDDYSVADSFSYPLEHLLRSGQDNVDVQCSFGGVNNNMPNIEEPQSVQIDPVGLNFSQYGQENDCGITSGDETDCNHKKYSGCLKRDALLFEDDTDCAFQELEWKQQGRNLVSPRWGVQDESMLSGHDEVQSEIAHYSADSNQYLLNCSNSVAHRQNHDSKDSQSLDLNYEPTRKISTLNSFMPESTKSHPQVLFSERRPYSLGDSSSKNAIAARENRIKKKQYVSGLEEKVSKMEVENKSLRQECVKNRDLLSSLQEEVDYYRSVISNQTTLSAVLKNVLKTPGVQLTTSFVHEDVNSLKEQRLILEGSKGEPLVPVNKGDSLSQSHSSVDSRDHQRRKVGTVTDKRKKNLRSISGGMKTRSMKDLPTSKKRKEMYCSRQSSHTGCSEDDNEEIGVDSVDSISSTPHRHYFPEHAETDGDATNTGGICLHVSGKAVSVEFCRHCNARAKFSVLSDHSYIKS
ncbi:uncharacterized protein LOC106012118 [Aplysia californica]|uniref:Uncharacterized protein LOC106012118 n=1 Tax=Aplysia californica TaxID=6500 RepID=A0ABM1A2D7_APLCA|nr:uncharacterized protein LOC106012118 [Aplysia californica]